jgi:hypothetical protein
MRLGDTLQEAGVAGDVGQEQDALATIAWRRGRGWSSSDCHTTASCRLFDDTIRSNDVAARPRPTMAERPSTR